MLGGAAVSNAVYGRGELPDGLGDGTPLPVGGGGGGTRANGYAQPFSGGPQRPQGYASSQSDYMTQSFGSMSLSDSQPFSMTESQQQQQASLTQTFLSQQNLSETSSQQAYSLSQDFVLTSSQEDMYRFGDVWGANPS